MLSDRKILVIPPSNQTQIDALVNIPRGAMVFNTTTLETNVASVGGATPVFEQVSKIGLQKAYDYNPDIQLEDNKRMTIQSSEKTVNEAITVLNIGANYLVGDVLEVVEGTSSQKCSFIVEAIDTFGAITQVRMTEGGTYTVVPPNPVTATGGTGTGATFNLTFQARTFTAFRKETIIQNLAVGSSGSIPAYADINLGLGTNGDSKCIVVASLDAGEESRMMAKNPGNSVYWYNGDLKRFRTSDSGVAKTILTEDDTPSNPDSIAFVDASGNLTANNDLKYDSVAKKIEFSGEDFGYLGEVVGTNYIPIQTFRVIANTAIDVGDFVAASSVVDFRVIAASSGDVIIGSAVTAAVNIGDEILISGAKILRGRTATTTTLTAGQPVEQSAVEAGRAVVGSNVGTIGASAQNAGVNSAFAYWVGLNEVF